MRSTRCRDICISAFRQAGILAESWMPNRLLLLPRTENLPAETTDYKTTLSRSPASKFRTEGGGVGE